LAIQRRGGEFPRRRHFFCHARSAKRQPFRPLVLFDCGDPEPPGAWPGSRHLTPSAGGTMSLPASQEKTEAIWSLSSKDPATTLFLLALLETRDPAEAAVRAGLPENQARLTIGWLEDRGIIEADGEINSLALRDLAGDKTPA
jgi:hypothetical protein